MPNRSFSGAWHGTEHVLTNGAKFVYQFTVEASGRVEGRAKPAVEPGWTNQLIGDAQGLKCSWKEYAIGLVEEGHLGTFEAEIAPDGRSFEGNGALIDGRPLRFTFVRQDGGEVREPVLMPN